MSLPLTPQGCLATAILATAILAPARSDDSGLPPTRPASAVVQLDAARAKVGNVLVDGEKAEVSFPGKIASAIRELEVFASAPHGRSYEGLIVCDAEPIDVAVALRLLGLEGGRGVEFQGQRIAPTGDPVEIFVEWKDTATGQPKRVRAEEMILNAKTNEPLPQMNWVHVGSRWSGRRFIAQAIGDIITLEHFPDIIIDNPLNVGAGDYIYEANPAVAPPPHTPVTVIIRAVKPFQPNANPAPLSPQGKSLRPAPEKKGLR